MKSRWLGADFMGSSPLHRAQLVDVLDVASAEDVNQDRQPNHRLGRGHGDRHQGEQVALEVLQLAGERDQREVDRVQNELDEAEEHKRVATHQHADRADGEEDRAKDQEPGCVELRSANRHPAHLFVDLLAAEVDGADRGDEQQQRRQLERVEVGGEQSDGDRLHGAEHGEVGGVGLPVLDAREHRPDHDQKREDEDCGEPGLEAQVRPGQLARGTEERDHEEAQDHDGAGVHDDLRDEDELRAQQQEQDAEGDHYHDQAQHAANGLVKADHADGAHDSHQGGDEENGYRQI